MRVHIGLGSNLGLAGGDKLAAIAKALEYVEELEGTSVMAVSSAVESEPWPNASSPVFVNAVAIIETSLQVENLLAAVKDIEVGMGRDPGAERNSPRVIDIDILLAQGEERTSGAAIIPHPRMAERDFVITPLLEVDADASWPDGSPVTRDGVRFGRVVRDLGPVSGFSRPPSVAAVGHEWETVLEFGEDPAPFSRGPAFVLGGFPGQVGMAGQVEGSLAEMVLTQERIAWMWDPFDPKLASDPYGFTRRYTLKVPAPDAVRARELLASIAAAPIDWSDAGEE